MARFTMPDGTIISLPGPAAKAASAKPRASRPANKPPSQAEIDGRVKAELEKQLMAKAVAERYEKIETLLKAAQDWRQRALDGRVSGLDRELREHLVRKAEAAETAAERLRRGETVSAADQAKAAELVAEAARYDRKAADATDNGVRAYYRDKAREVRTLAGLARGERADDSGNNRRR